MRCSRRCPWRHRAAAMGDRPLQPIEFGHGIRSKPVGLSLPRKSHRPRPRRRAAGCAADGDPRVNALVAEDLDHQVRRAVEHLGMVGKAGRRIDEAVEAQQLDDAVEVAQSAALACARMLRAQSRAASLPLGEVDLGADLAGDCDLAVIERQLTGNEELAVEVKEGDIAGDAALASGRTRSSAFRRASISPAMGPPCLSASPKARPSSISVRRARAAEWPPLVRLWPLVRKIRFLRAIRPGCRDRRIERIAVFAVALFGASSGLAARRDPVRPRSGARREASRTSSWRTAPSMR